MELEDYLRSLHVSEADIERLRDEKVCYQTYSLKYLLTITFIFPQIDCNVISVMSDEELAWFLKSTGDRVLVRNFVKTRISSEQRKEHLIKNVRERLAAIRSKRMAHEPPDKKRKRKNTLSGGPNTKSTRQLYMGWKHKEKGRLTQVIEKKGGGTKLLSMPKDYTKTEIIELGKKIYFPNGKSSKGPESLFCFDLINNLNKILSPDKSVLELLEEYSPKIPRIYIQSERLIECSDSDEEVQYSHVILNSELAEDIRKSTTPVVSNDGEQFLLETEDPASGPDSMHQPETNTEDNVVILYADRSISKYSEQTVISFKEKHQIFDDICRTQGPPNVDLANFDPVDFDYPVARIEVNGLVTLNIESQFLHQVNEPNPLDNPPAVTAAAESSTNSCQLVETLLPIIARKDIKFSEKILGAGSQGTVREGNWLGTQVAIKSFKTGRLTEMELREVKLLARIRHPHIIQIMGISLENRQTHMIFELVKGDNLGDILFDEEKKERYQLDDRKKNKLLLEVCQAISYLHGQTNPIIHQDIKPDNILVSENCDIKLCDLGLAKFKTMATQFRTVVGSLKGTIAYMAPEILLSEATASTSSDIWSLGCTILETFTEGDVWPDLEDNYTEVLKQKMKNLETPNIDGIPKYLQLIVNRCFRHIPAERPNIEELMNCFNVKQTEDEPP